VNIQVQIDIYSFLNRVNNTEDGYNSTMFRYIDINLRLCGHYF